MISQLPADADPRLVDMCCGSGAMVVTAVRQSMVRICPPGTVPDQDCLRRLSQAITGFDIDPLAVMLAKVAWVLAAREWFTVGAGDISIPIFHADSLFAATPLSRKVVDDSGSTTHELLLDDYKVALPSFLISPVRARFLIRYLTVVTPSQWRRKAPLTDLLNSSIELIIDQVSEQTGDTLSAAERTATMSFCRGLLLSLEALQRAGRNGIWAFVLRNSYRPGLVVGQFNGLASNPPWLALSKVADNPYKDALRERADDHAIKPAGSSFLHIELATIFLLHAVRRYLTDDAHFGCILPESILSAHHHNPFRQGAYLTAPKPVNMAVDEIWRVAHGTFKNEAVVLFGTRSVSEDPVPPLIPGMLADPAGSTPITFRRVSQGNRTAWTDSPVAGADKVGFFDPAEFRQGQTSCRGPLYSIQSRSLREADGISPQSIPRTNDCAYHRRRKEFQGFQS